MYALIRWLLNALILLLIPHLIGGVEVASLFTALITALILAFVNAIIRPIILILTLPINILTLGLFTFVINALMFWFVASFVKGFNIIGFWPAFWAALIFSAFSVIINYFVDKNPQRIN